MKTNTWALLLKASAPFFCIVDLYYMVRCIVEEKNSHGSLELPLRMKIAKSFKIRIDHRLSKKIMLPIAEVQ